MWRGLLDLLLPRRCCGCGAVEAETPFCAECRVLVERVPPWVCVGCSRVLPEARGSSRCSGCAAEPPPYAELLAPFVYGGPVATAIRRLKYRGGREVARLLAPFLAEAAKQGVDGDAIVAPIPLHAERRLLRGYDQALLLALELSRTLRLPCKAELLVRTRRTEPQVGAGREGRGANLRGAFQASPLAASRKVLLVDDVVTTASTARAAAEALRDAGAGEVWVIALARAL